MAHHCPECGEACECDTKHSAAQFDDPLAEAACVHCPLSFEDGGEPEGGE